MGRKIPENSQEADAVLKRYRPYGRMIVTTIDRGARFAEVAPLDAEEKEDGTFAFSALLYEEGAELSARLLVLLWIVSIVSLRLVEFFDKREEKKRRDAHGLKPLPVGDAK